VQLPRFLNSKVKALVAGITVFVAVVLLRSAARQHLKQPEFEGSNSVNPNSLPAQTPPVNTPGIGDDQAQTPKVSLSVEEQNELRARMQAAETEMRRLEQESSKTIAEISSEGTLNVLLLIPTPTGDTYAAYSEALGAAMRGASERIRSASSTKAKELLDSYVSFSSPYRIVSAYFPSEKEMNDPGNPRVISFAENYIESPESVEVLENGNVRYTNTRGSTGFKDHGVPRYSYLFEKYSTQSNGK